MKRRGKQTNNPNREAGKTGETRLEIRRQRKISVNLDREKKRGREGNKVISETETTPVLPAYLLTQVPAVWLFPLPKGGKGRHVCRTQNITLGRRTCVLAYLKLIPFRC